MAFFEFEIDALPVDDYADTIGDAEPRSIRVSNPDKENGAGSGGPLSWLNSARITLDPDDDAVYCAVSVGDPRGAFVFTVRRLTDGRLVIHTPYPGETCAHESTRELHPGTLEVIHYGTDEPVIFEDDEDEDES